MHLTPGHNSFLTYFFFKRNIISAPFFSHDFQNIFPVRSIFISSVFSPLFPDLLEPIMPFIYISTFFTEFTLTFIL